MFSLYCYAGWDTLWHFKRFLKCIKYIIFGFTPPLLSLSPFPHSWNSFSRYHFCIYMHVYTFFVAYSPSYPLSSLPQPLLLVPALPPVQDLVSPPVLQFCRREKRKRKTWQFCLFETKVVTQGVSL
jgi:hypothetical protein